MQIVRTLLLLAAISGLSFGCMTRVDPGQVLRQLPQSPAQSRYLEIYKSSECQEALQQDDAECWQQAKDGDVVVIMGVTRSLRGYALSPYSVQTHLKIRVQNSQHGAEEVFYFADGGSGGLEAHEGFGLADGQTNVFCHTHAQISLGVDYDNDEVTQSQADAIVACVHGAVQSQKGFAPAVKACLGSVQTDMRIAQR